MVPLRAGRILVYNSMSGGTAIWEKTEAEVFQSIERGQAADVANRTVSELLYGGFVVRPEINELEILRTQYEAIRNDPSKMILTIAPTLMCNFGCDYCFQGQNKPGGFMGPEVQDAIIALLSRAAPTIKRLHIAWYGGEPLLAPAVIASLSDRVISICDQRGIAFDAMIVTNGYNLTVKVARSLYTRRVKTAQITLDGAARDHDQRRTRLGGGPSFARIVKNLRAVVDDVALRISIRINIELRNKGSIYELLDELCALGFGKRRNFSVYFAPVEAITAGCHCVVNKCMSKADYGQLEAELTRYAFNAGLTSLPYPPRFRGVCGALTPKGFVVLPNGDLHKCWDTVSMPQCKVGTIFDVDALRTDDRVLRWARWTPFENGVCTHCKILPNCAGSCAHKFLNTDQTLGEAASLPCPSWKYNIKERLLLMAERSGAISPGDFDLEQVKTNSAEICPVVHHKPTGTHCRNAANFADIG